MVNNIRKEKVNKRNNKEKINAKEALYFYKQYWETFYGLECSEVNQLNRGKNLKRIKVLVNYFKGDKAKVINYIEWTFNSKPEKFDFVSLGLVVSGWNLDRFNVNSNKVESFNLNERNKPVCFLVDNADVPFGKWHKKHDPKNLICKKCKFFDLCSYKKI
ncbi:MAG: hypothetical protein GF317_04910 [Candidatus Lokiarchaeota archaeon]|nr:hypothetical protein [Candidatus Lokiarchaeota archaeon]